MLHDFDVAAFRATPLVREPFELSRCASIHQARGVGADQCRLSGDLRARQLSDCPSRLRAGLFALSSTIWKATSSAQRSRRNLVSSLSAAPLRRRSATSAASATERSTPTRPASRSATGKSSCCGTRPRHRSSGCSESGSQADIEGEDACNSESNPGSKVPVWNHMLPVFV
jgi:hypothetical protein